MIENIGYIIVFVVIMACLPFFQKLVNSFIDHKERYPYHSKYILTNTEYKFFVVLKPLMEVKGYIICPKVGLKDLFEVNKGTKERQKYFYKISQKHIDFLICDSKLVPLFAIELDDKSHKQADVKERDKFKDELFKVAGLPLYRVPTVSTYSEEYVKSHISSFLDSTESDVSSSKKV